MKNFPYDYRLDGYSIAFDICNPVSVVYTKSKHIIDKYSNSKCLSV